MRISGINVPDEKKLEIGLSYIYGIGRNNVKEILAKAKIDGSKKVNTLTEEEQKRIQKALEDYKIEGDALPHYKLYDRNGKMIHAFVSTEESPIERDDVKKRIVEALKK